MIVRGTSRQLKHVALEWAISYNRGQYRPEKEATGLGMPTNIRSAVWKRKKLERGPKWLGRRAAGGERGGGGEDSEGGRRGGNLVGFNPQVAAAASS